MPESNPRIVIFTSSDSIYAPLMLRPLLEQFHEQVVAVITGDRAGQGKKFHKLRKVHEQAGMRYALLKVILFSMVKIYQRLRIYPTINALCESLKIRRIDISSLKSASTLALLKGLQADIFISVLYEKIFPPEILRIPAKAALNLHPAPLPRYAGVAPVFWVLSQGETGTGVTIHHLEEGIDTGEIFLRVEVPIGPHESVHGLYRSCSDAGGKLLIESVKKLNQNDIPRITQIFDNRTYFSSPTSEGYMRLRQNGHSLFSFKDLLKPI